MKIRLWPVACALAGALAIAASISGGVRAQDEALPDGPGKQDLLDACTSCHDAGTVTAERHSAADWSDVVDQMVGMGATVSDAQDKSIVAYLATNFGPAPVPAVAPAGSTPAAAASAPSAGPAATPPAN